LTKKQKKPSSSIHPIFFAALSIPLIGFFIYASLYEIRFFAVLAIILIIIICYLIYNRHTLRIRESEIILQKEDCLEKANLLKVEISKEDRAIKASREKIEDFSQLKDVTEKLSLSLSLTDTSNTLSKEVTKFFRDTTVILYMFHSKTGELGISSSQKGQMRVNIKSKKGDTYDQYVIKTMQPLLIEDTKSDWRFDFEKVATEDTRTIRSIMSVPLTIENKTLGILRVDSPEADRFKTEDLRLLMTVGDLGGIAIENAQLYEKIEDLAIRDGLTGLYLRRYLTDRMSQEISRVMRRKKKLSFLMIDLDKFKQYNDKFGHTAGDIVLRTVGMLLQDHFGEPGNLLCRYGGEEFAVLLPDCTKEQAKKQAEEIRKKIEMHTVILRREKTKITASIGVATFPDDASGKDELIHCADNCLYKAKEKGRNKVVTA